MYNQGYFYHRLRAAQAYIRILHASPDAPPIDVYANDSLLFQNFSYRQFSEYLQIPSGAYNIKVYPAGQTVNPLINKNINIPDNSIFTLSMIELLTNMDLLPVPDPVMQIPTGKTYLRLVHLSPDTTNVDVTLPDGSVLFKNVAYRGITDYIPVNPGGYTFETSLSGSGRRILHVPNIQLLPDRFYSLYFVGLLGGIPGLQMLIPLDGGSYIHF